MAKVNVDRALKVATEMELFGKEAEFAVKSALRRTAQATRTQTRRVIAQRHGLPQAVLKGRIGAFGRRKGAQNIFRAWVGAGRPITDQAHPRIAALARKAGFFEAEVPGRKVRYWRRRGTQRVPLEHFAVRLAEPDGELLEREARDAYGRVYPERLTRELARRAVKARGRKKIAESRAAQRQIARLLSSLNYQGDI